MTTGGIAGILKDQQFNSYELLDQFGDLMTDQVPKHGRREPNGMDQKGNKSKAVDDCKKTRQMRVKPPESTKNVVWLPRKAG